MKNTKRFLALVLCLVMVLSLAACNNNKTTPTGTDKPSEAPASPTDNPAKPTDKPAEPTPTEAPKYDFGGRTIRIGSYYDMTPDPQASALKEALANRIKFVEDNYHCHVEFVDLGGDYFNTYVTSVLSGEPCCDIGYVMTYKLLPSLIEGGIAYPISDLKVIDFDDYKWRQDVVRAGEYKGKNYGMLLKDPEIRYGIFWNKTLFQKYGLPDLYELYEKDEWTWDKFKEIAIQGNIDLDGDGSYDIHGFNERESLEWCYLYSNGAEIAAKTDSGMTIDLDNPKVIEALTGLQDFTTNVDYLHGWLGDWQSQIYSFRDGQSMMCLEEYWISYSYLTKEGEAMVDDWGWVPFPKGPSATDWSCYGKEFGGRFLLNGVENPEQVLQIYNLITDIAETEDEWEDLLESQLENWSVDKQTVENVSYINDKGVGNINAVKGFSGIESAMNAMFNAIKDGSKTPQTAIDENRSLILAAVADASNHDYNADMQEILNQANQQTTEE